MLVLEDLDHAMPHVSDAQEQVQENRPEMGGGGGGAECKGHCIITIVKSEVLAHTSICLDSE